VEKFLNKRRLSEFLSDIRKILTARGDVESLKICNTILILLAVFALIFLIPSPNIST